MDAPIAVRRSPVRRVARWVLGGIPANAAFPILSGPLRGRRWIVRSGLPRIWLGSFELGKQRAFAQVVEAGMTVYDIGAHAGVYTLLAAGQVGPRGQVVAFEPLPGNASTLRRHLRLNQIANAKVYEVAIADSDGVGRFRSGATTYQGSLSTDGEINVPIARIDTLRAQHALPLPNVVKIDIEGAEHGALLGAAETIQQGRPVIFLATHGAEVQANCVALLQSFDYVVETISPGELIATPRSTPSGG